MPVTSTIRDVFSYFQNLNLLVLLHDLRKQETVRQAWSAGRWLCPVAHGLAAGAQVRELYALGQGADLEESCEYAARRLGASPPAVLRFVRSWDEQVLRQDRLLQELQEIWEERVEDAEAVQEILRAPASCEESTQLDTMSPREQQRPSRAERP